MAENNAFQKPEIPREVADELTSYLEIYSFDELMGDIGRSYHGLITEYPAFKKVEKRTLILAATVGYTVEKSPEGKVRELYEECNRIHAALSFDSTDIDYYDGKIDGIEETLNLLGVEIPGVNVPEDGEDE
jgi:hypothetical protein